MNQIGLRFRFAFFFGVFMLTTVVVAASCAQGEVTFPDPCDDGELKCGNECVDTAIDQAHCGDCNKACAPYQACEDSACVDFCDVSLVNCDGVCINTQVNAQHCGACGAACEGSDLCIGGQCQSGCPAGLTACNGTCVNTETDATNCGSCGVVCEADESCLSGTCEFCGPGLTECMPNVCINLLIDVQNCGACGNACGPGFTCMGGSCTSVCGPNQIFCDPSCVDPQTDNMNCGGCGISCNVLETCTAGACSCPTSACGLCILQDLGSSVPQTINGTTTGLPNAYQPSCNPIGGNDSVYSFTAPADGTYAFDTLGSSYDTTIVVLDQACAEIACNDDFQGSQSKAIVDLVQNQVVYVIVDGFGAGNFVLHVTNPPPCPSNDLGSTVPQTVTGTTIGQTNDFSPTTCATSNAPDVEFKFTAPVNGIYTFDTNGSAFDTVLYVLNGNCAGSEIACDDDGGVGTQSLLTVNLTAGQMIVVILDGYSSGSGSYVLNVSVQAAPVCPTGNLPSMIPQTVMGSTLGAGNAITPSCGASTSGDATYTFTAPMTTMYSFDTIGSAYNTVVSVRNATCNGAELACNDDYQGTQSRALASLTAGQTVVVAVDGFGSATGSYVLNVSEYIPPACPVTVLPSMVPQTVTGSTLGLPNNMTPGCSSSSAPETTYGFTAPANGTYTFDTIGSAFDTILYVRNATCMGAELGCDDDSGGSATSLVTLPLTAGQTVVIVVDGYSTASGAYTLHIN